MSSRSKWIIEKTEAVSSDGMVCAMHPLAAEAGAEVLRQGGSAVDAAVAAALAVGVVEPFMSGLGGVAWMIVRDAASGRTQVLDGSSTLPSSISTDLFELVDEEVSGLYGWRATKGDAANTGWLTPAAPGTPKLLSEAHRRFGRLPWRDLVEPARTLAEDGYEVDSYAANTIAGEFDRLSAFPEAKRIFFKPSGAPYSSSSGYANGDRLVQPDLARTLRLVQEEGAETVYTGEVAELIARDMTKNGGLITQGDLAAYEVRVLEPCEVDYRGYQVLGQLENTGYATVTEALQILEGFAIDGLGAGTTEVVHLETEAIRHAFVDRLRHLGDASIVPVPYHGVISKEYAAQRREAIERGRATPEAKPGEPWPYENATPGWKPDRSAIAGEGQTTHITVVDRDRNMVSLTSTLGAAFGSGVAIKDTGIVLNNATMWFDPVPGAAASIGPNKRMMSAASNLLVLREGNPLLAVGAPGGRRVISSVFQAVVNVTDFGLGMQEAVSAPRIHCEGPETSVSDRFTAETIDGLRHLGHRVTVRSEAFGASWFARPNGVLIGSENELRGGVFQFTPATAIGV